MNNQNLKPFNTWPADEHRAVSVKGGIASGRSRLRKAYIRAVIAYHERHNPPRLAADYWQEAAEDISRVSSSLDNEPFAMALLVAVYGEMERAYKHLEASRADENAP